MPLEPIEVKPVWGNRRRNLPLLLGPNVATFLGAWLVNYLFIARPVARTFGADPRNAGYTLTARYSYYINPSILVLDLREVSKAAPIDFTERSHVVGPGTSYYQLQV